MDILVKITWLCDLWLQSYGALNFVQFFFLGLPCTTLDGLRSFYEVQDGCRPPTWICWWSRRTIHEGRFMMGISCENFVMIGLVLSSYKDLNILLLRLESPIHVQKLFLGRGVAPKFSTSFRPPFNMPMPVGWYIVRAVQEASHC